MSEAELPPRTTIPDPGFADDDGTVPAGLAAALDAYAAHGRHPDGYAQVLAELQRSRLLVPVVALLGEVEYDAQGLAHDKSSDMAAVLMQGADGRLALLAFTGLEPMRSWDPQARPVPVAARLAARSALQDGAAALVVDLAGPVRFVVEGDDLRGLAEGWTLAWVAGGTGWIRAGDA